MSSRPIRVGFLVGKDNDAVDDPKYAGDTSFLRGMPDKWRVDPKSNEYLMDCKKGTKGQVHADVAIPWYIQTHTKDIQIDIITPKEITKKRLKSNLCNFMLGYDAVSALLESTERWRHVRNAFKACGNLVASWEFQNFIYYKSRYMQACIDAGIPMAPTIFAIKGKRSASKLLGEIKQRGWKEFVLKHSYSAFSLGFTKLTVAKCEADPGILRGYFREHSHVPEFVVQESVPGFVRNWETRCFWFNGKFLYAIANKAAVSTADGKEVIITGDDIPKDFLENAKRIGARALKVLPPNAGPGGKDIGLSIIRTDVGCSDSKLNDRGNTWDPSRKTFFLNEIEYDSANLFIRHLKFDAVPLWAKRIAEKVRRVKRQARTSGAERRAGLKRASAVGPAAHSKRARVA